MINKEIYFNQVKEILSSDGGLNFKEFEDLYDFYLNGKNVSEVDKVLLCDLIVKRLFDSSLYTSLLIPWYFLDTPIGRVLISVKFGVESSDIFFVSEIVELLGKKQQYISREIKDGKLKGYKRGGKVIIYKNDLAEYIKDKGFNINEYSSYERTEKYGEE